MGAQNLLSGCGVPAPKLVIIIATESFFRSSGLPQVYSLRCGVIKDILPVKYLTPNIFMDVNYCVRELARSLGCSSPAYNKEEGATPHHGACRHSWHYCSRHDWCLGVQDETWSIGSLGG